MDSFTFNKIAGAVLGTCLVGLGIEILAESYFFPPPPKKPGYALPEPKEVAKGGGEKAPAIVPISMRLQKADPKKGENDTKICGACHNFQEGAGAKVGPDLYGVVDRPKGSVEGFDYSAGMKKKGGKWTYADLDQFLTKPSAYVEGTKMGYSGEQSPEKRADIIAYLRTLSHSPAAMPQVSDADKKAAEGGGKQASAEGGAGGGEVVKAVASADASKGKSDAQVCTACHNLQKGGGVLVGPPLWGVVDRPKGSVQGFDYSAGMKKKGGNWTYADLNQFLTKPQAYVQGTKMGFAGEANPKKRAEIIAFLRTLADKPAPLPTGGAEKGASAPAGGEKADASTGGGDKTAAGGEIVKTIALADAAKGKSDAQICSACHNLQKGGGVLVGPPLWGVVDRPKGSVQGFDYSAGMKKKGGNWTYADLNQFLTKPQAYVQGTKMGFAGEANPKKRAEIIAFLRTLSDSPAPLPGDGSKSAAKPDEKKTEAPPPAKPEPEKKTEAAPPAPAPAKKTEATPPTPDQSVKKASAQPGGGSEGIEPPVGADPQYPTEKVEATSLPQHTTTPPSLPAASEKSDGAEGAPEPYAAPTPDEVK